MSCSPAQAGVHLLPLRHATPVEWARLLRHITSCYLKFAIIEVTGDGLLPSQEHGDATIYGSLPIHDF